MSSRLEKIVEFVDNNSIVADIGTDHGLVPIYLSKNRIAKRIIGIDVSEKSLLKLKLKIENNLKYQNIYPIVSDGLKGLKPFEVDTIIISGMGGLLISKILSDSPEVAKSVNTLILQGNNNIEALRRFLHENGYIIADESDVFENNKYYQILKVESGLEQYKKDYYYEFGKILIEKGSYNLNKFINLEIKKIDNIIDNIKALSKEEMTEKINNFNERKEYLRQVTKEIESNRSN